MTGYAVVDTALKLLGYVTPQGETDNGLNAELLPRALTILNQVLGELQHIAGVEEITILEDLLTELPLTEKVARLAAVPGVAMYLAQGAGDNDSFNRFADVYEKRMHLAARPHGRVKDVVPRPIG